MKQNKQNKQNKQICILCGDLQPESDMSLINEKGTKACPRCIFLIALYHSLGIDKKLRKGGLMPHKLNAKFQKILKKEFYPHPKETYRKYLGQMIDEEENRLGLVRLTEEQFTAVKSEEFPFVFLDVSEAEKLSIKPGRVLILQVGDCGDNRLERKVYSSKLLTVKQAKVHGFKRQKVVCFLPKEEV